MVVIWLVSFWESLNKPKKINIVELGPGNGDFSEILVKTLKNFPQILKSVNIYLYEKSEKLTKIPKKKEYPQVKFCGLKTLMKLKRDQ